MMVRHLRCLAQLLVCRLEHPHLYIERVHLLLLGVDECVLALDDIVLDSHLLRELTYDLLTVLQLGLQGCVGLELDGQLSRKIPYLSLQFRNLGGVVGIGG